MIRRDRVNVCANQTCSNNSREGQMTVVTLTAESGRASAITLIMCAPCAENINEQFMLRPAPAAGTKKRG